MRQRSAATEVFRETPLPQQSRHVKGSGKWSSQQRLQVIAFACVAGLLFLVALYRGSGLSRGPSRPDTSAQALLKRHSSVNRHDRRHPDDERHPIYGQTIVSLRTLSGEIVDGFEKDHVQARKKTTPALFQLVVEKQFAGYLHHGDRVWIQHYQSRRYFNSEPNHSAIAAKWTDKGNFQMMTLYKVGYKTDNSEAHKTGTDTLVRDDDLVRFQVYSGNATDAPRRFMTYSLGGSPKKRFIRAMTMSNLPNDERNTSTVFKLSVDHIVLPNSQPTVQDAYGDSYHYDTGTKFVPSKGCVHTAEIKKQLNRTDSKDCKARILHWHCSNVAGLSRFRVDYSSKAKEAKSVVALPQLLSNSLVRRCGLPRRMSVPRDHKMLELPAGSASKTSVAYVILGAPHEDVSLFELLEQLYHERDTFVIHIDTKDNTKAAALKKKIKKKFPRGNLVVLHTRSITWGGFSMLLAELDALTMLLKLGRKFEYVINLSATAYPIKTRDDIMHSLSQWHTTNHLELFKQVEGALFARATRHWFVECAEAGRVLRMPGTKPLLSGVGYFGGSQWFVLRKEFVVEVMRCLQRKVPGDEDRCTYIRDILEYHRYALISDETFMQTVSMASPFCNSVKPTSLHWVAWNRKKDAEDRKEALKKTRENAAKSNKTADWNSLSNKTAGDKHKWNHIACPHGDVVDWCGTSPGLVKGNTGFMTERAPQLWARKFGQDDAASKGAKKQIKAYLTARGKAQDANRTHEGQSTSGAASY